MAGPFSDSEPNLPLPTFGGLQLWSDVYWNCGWRIQRHSLTGHCRLLDPRDLRRAWGTREACRADFERRRAEGVLAGVDPDGERDHLVILLHGLGRSRRSLTPVRCALEAEGFAVAALSHASTRQDIARAADQVQEVCEQLEGVARVSFVTHSLGGLIARELLGRDAAWKARTPPQRLVMLAPPSRGSQLARRLSRSRLFGLGFGPAGLQLAARGGLDLPLPEIPFAIVAARRSRPGGANPWIAGDDDGIVGLSETALPGAALTLEVESWHALIMREPAVIRAILEFLEAAPGECGEAPRPRTRPASWRPAAR